MRTPVIREPIVLLPIVSGDPPPKRDCYTINNEGKVTRWVGGLGYVEPEFWVEEYQFKES